MPGEAAKELFLTLAVEALVEHAEQEAAEVKEKAA